MQNSEIMNTTNGMDPKDIREFLLVLKSMALGLIKAPAGGIVGPDGQARFIRSEDGREVTHDEWIEQIGAAKTANARGFEGVAGDGA